ncbi:palmitoyltransferase ZDHHC18-A [Latimeria chalumnae]|nr:PREDICTED: GPI mannosyltransferase 2 [Latimeria chalumnae]XP_014341051.1 PREDICTED: GPI mannosyltransferase 2 [Latimeria chalumnae]|eukprot:XP_005991068.1 PREDICTED: GPI mannosyltransferase 2 [Latimeria chalumnae]
MEDPLLWTVVQFAVCSRILTVVLQAVLNFLIPDHKPNVFSPPRLYKFNHWDTSVEFFFSGFSHWDAEHFLFIAEHGYLYEHNLAFFPLFPLCVRTVAETFLWPLQWTLHLRSRLLLSAVLLNSAIFVLAAVALYKLGCVVLQNRKLAYLSSLLYCITPANVFMAAAYSEGVFALMAFSGMYKLEKRQRLLSCILFSFATAARSNGIVNAGFLIYTHVKHSVLQLTADIHAAPKPLWKLRSCRSLLKSTLLIVVETAVIFLPFILFQYYAYQNFCVHNFSPERKIPSELVELARTKGYHVVNARKKLPTWCFQFYPVAYSYIQDVYWNVGFLRYYQFKQIPNFLVALPIIVLGFWAAWHYVIMDPSYCIRLGLVNRNKGREEFETGYHSFRVFVYAVHAAVLLVFGVLYIHIQVVTRFLMSSSPLVYWFCAHLLQKSEPLVYADKSYITTSSSPQQSHAGGSFLHDILRNYFPINPVTELLLQWKKCTLTTKCILGYFLSYWLFGLVLHCNFLPWT